MATDGIDLTGTAALPPAGRSAGRSASPRPSIAPVEGNAEQPRRPAARIEPRDLEAQLASVNQRLREQRSDLSFSIDEGTGKTVVRVVRESTGELVRQIPSEEVLAIAEALSRSVPGGSLGVEAWS